MDQFDNQDYIPEDDRVNNSRGKKKRKRKGDFLSYFLLVVALLLLALGLYLLIEPKIRHNQQDKAGKDLIERIESDNENYEATITFRSDEMVVNGEVAENFGNDDVDHKEIGRTEPGNATAPAESSEEKPKKTNPQVVTVHGIATMRIPSIDLVMPVAGKADVYSLRVAVGHYSTTALPPEEGIGVYFGHRMYNYGRVFNRLDEVPIGSEILIDFQGKRYTYTVDKNYMIPAKPKEMNSTLFRQAEEGEQRIILVTCDPKNAPPGKSPRRLLVEGVLTNVAERKR